MSDKAQSSSLDDPGQPASQPHRVEQESAAENGCGAAASDAASGDDASASEDLASIDRQLAGLGEQLAGLGRSFAEKIKSNQLHQQAFDRLYEELQQYKEGSLFRLVEPVLRDVIGLYDDLGDILRPETPLEKLLKSLEIFRYQILDALEKHGLQPFAADSGPYDNRRQKAIRTVPCDDPLLDRMVESSQRDGFMLGERVFRPQQVQVYKHEPPAAASAVPDPSGESAAGAESDVTDGLSGT